MDDNTVQLFQKSGPCKEKVTIYKYVGENAKSKGYDYCNTNSH